MTDERKPDGTFAEGNRANAKAKVWSDVLRKYSVQNPNELMAIVKSLFDKAKDGDVAAIREIGDRLEGKVSQQVDLGNADDKPFRVITQVALVALDGNCKDTDTK